MQTIANPPSSKIILQQEWRLGDVGPLARALYLRVKREARLRGTVEFPLCHVKLWGCLVSGKRNAHPGELIRQLVDAGVWIVRGDCVRFLNVAILHPEQSAISDEKRPIPDSCRPASAANRDRVELMKLSASVNIADPEILVIAARAAKRTPEEIVKQIFAEAEAEREVKEATARAQKAKLDREHAEQAQKLAAETERLRRHNLMEGAPDEYEPPPAELVEHIQQEHKLRPPAPGLIKQLYAGGPVPMGLYRAARRHLRSTGERAPSWWKLCAAMERIRKEGALADNIVNQLVRQCRQDPQGMSVDKHGARDGPGTVPDGSAGASRTRGVVGS